MIKKFLQDESGQGTVEYVLFLVILVTIILSVGKSLMSRFQSLVTNQLAGKLTRGFFNPEAMYRFTLF